MTVKVMEETMNWTDINSIVGILAFVIMVLGGLLKLFADQVKMKQKVENNHQRHESNDEVVDEIKERQHEITRRQDVSEAKLIDHKEILNKMDLKLDRLIEISSKK